ALRRDRRTHVRRARRAERKSGDVARVRSQGCARRATRDAQRGRAAPLRNSRSTLAATLRDAIDEPIHLGVNLGCALRATLIDRLKAGPNALFLRGRELARVIFRDDVFAGGKLAQFGGQLLAIPMEHARHAVRIAALPRRCQATYDLDRWRL